MSEPAPEPAAGGDLALHVDRRRGGRAGARLHHAQHARAPTSRARAACRDGKQLPPFAAPLATSKLVGRRQQVDPQARRARCAAPRHPQLCQLAERGPVVLGVLRHPLQALRRRRSTCSSACAGASPTSASRRSSMRGDRGDVRAGWCASTAGRCRSATTTTARSPTPTRSRSARRSRFARRGGVVHSARTRRSALLERRRRCRAAIDDDAARALDRRRTIAGGVPGAAPLSVTLERRAPGRSPPGAARAAADALRPLPRRARRSSCAASRSRTPTASSSATSGSTPTSTACRSRRSRSSG